MTTSDAALANDLVLRPETPSDYEEVHRIVADAFGREVEADLVGKIRDSPGYLAPLALVAEREGAVVGHVMVSNALLRCDSGDQVIAMLSPLAVDPVHQRLGIGAALVHEVCARTSDLCYTFVVLEGSPTYYGRLGFGPAAKYGITLPMPEWAPQEAAQLRPLAGFATNTDPRSGSTADPTSGSTTGRSSGSTTGRLSGSVQAGSVVYPEPFHGLD